MKRIVLLSGFMFMSACGSSPTAPAPSPTTLAITGGSDFLLTGQSFTLTAAATTKGSTTNVAATWSSDSGAASVDANGRVTGVKNGSSTITATYQGAVARQSVNVIQNYSGSWTGDYTINRCDASGDFSRAGFCSIFRTGSSLPISLSLSQTRNSVSGSIARGSITGNISGSVDNGGGFSGSGSLNAVSNGIQFTYAMGGFNASVDGTRFVANWAEDITANGLNGKGYLELSTRNVGKSSVGSAPLTIHPNIFDSTIEMWRAMGAR